MCKTTNRALILSLAGTLLCGISFAQQSSAPTTNPPAASPATPAAPKTQKAPAAKTGTTAAQKPASELVLNTKKDKASYAIGMNIGKGLKDNLKKDNVDIDPAILARGIKDALAGGKELLTDDESKAILAELQNDVRAHQQEAATKKSQAGVAYLAANKDKPGVVVLPSGLQYKIITAGTGPRPTANDTVVCNYRGTLVDGTEFDSSYKRGQPATFPVGQVIKGWTEALQLMPVGSKWELYIPSSLGYGERGTPNGGPIGPNETLIFEVELMSIQAKTETKPAANVTPEAKPQAQQPQAQPQAQTQPAEPQAKPQ